MLSCVERDLLERSPKHEEAVGSKADKVTTF